MTGTRLRWVASAALAVVAVILLASLLDRGPSPAASVDPASTLPTSGTAMAPQSSQSSSTPSSGREPAASPDPAGASADPDAGPPLRPDATLGLSVPSAEALAHFYLGRAVNDLKLTGDGAAVRAVTSEACTPCREEIAVFVATNGRNKRLAGDYLWKNLQVRAVRSTGTRSAVVDIDATRGRHAAVETPGAPKHYPGGRVSLQLTLVAEGNDWTIFDLGLR
jgi:hypothetical protein